MATVNETRLQAYIDAEAAILKGQSWQFGDRRLQRADLQFVQGEIARLQRAVAAETAARSGSARYASADFGGCT